ncbi:MAG: DUF349 domain-containing protein [Bacteroidales bacterium]|jgi:hypothetical protein|nr:DUF349 domain-containing protein [Bacteroidales bacterium]
MENQQESQLENQNGTENQEIVVSQEATSTAENTAQEIVEKAESSMDEIPSIDEFQSIETELSMEPLAETENETNFSDTASVEPIVAENEEVSEKSINTELSENENITEEKEISDDFFDHLDRQQIVQTLENVVKDEDVVKIKRQVALLKLRFLYLNKEYKLANLQAFLDAGGEREDYKEEIDKLEERYNLALNRYKTNKQRYVDALEHAKEGNLEKKKALLEELKQLVESNELSLKQIHDRFGEIQALWKEVGPVPMAEVNTIWQNYHFYVEKFFDKVKMNRELRDLDMKKNLELKIELCEKMEALILEPAGVKVLRVMQEYRQQWRNIGGVGEDKNDEIWERFRTAIDAVNENCRQFFDKLDEEQQANLTAKLELCNQMEQLLTAPCPSTDRLHSLGNKVAVMCKTWKTIGNVPKEQHQTVWERFTSAVNTFYTNKKELHEQLKAKETENYNARINLCIQAEAIAKRTDWKKAAAELEALKEQWKQAGPIPARISDEIWNRFQAAGKSFYAARNACFAENKKNEADNIAAKKELIEKAKNFVMGDNVDENFEILKDLQRQWLETGFVSAEKRKELKEEFASIIDKHFSMLKNSAQVSLDQYKQFVDRMHEKSGRSVVTREMRYLKGKVEQITKDIALWENNLGFFSKSQESTALKEQFGKKIEQAKADLTDLQQKIKILMQKKKEIEELYPQGYYASKEKEEESKPLPPRKTGKKQRHRDKDKNKNKE